MRQVEGYLIEALRRLEKRNLFGAQHMAHHVDGKLVVACRHRRVRRKDDATPHGIEIRLVELEARAPIELPLEEAEREQRRMSLVQVIVKLTVVAEGAKNRRAAHTQE